MTQDDVIQFYDRRTGTMQAETVLGDAAIRWAYQALSGRCCAPLLFGSSLPSRLLGAYFNSSWSRKKIAATIDDLGIDTSEFLQQPSDYRHFNDFFTRRLRPEARPFSDDPQAVISPADGRLLVYPAVDSTTALSVKGVEAPLAELFGPQPPQAVEQFDGGDVAVVRLCPADYHRYHFPCAGTIGECRSVRGAYHSVNPVALAAQARVFCRNKRAWTIINSNEFGPIAFIEVGAFGVAGIHNTYVASPGSSATGTAVQRMQEKGYFDFGGSTIVMVYARSAIVFDDDLREKSAAGVETLVRVGETIGRARP